MDLVLHKAMHTYAWYMKYLSPWHLCVHAVYTTCIQEQRLYFTRWMRVICICTSGDYNDFETKSKTRVCMYVHKYCMHVCKNVCMHVCMYVCMHVYVCVCMCMYVYVCMYVCIYIYTSSIIQFMHRLCTVSEYVTCEISRSQTIWLKHSYFDHAHSEWLLPCIL